MLGDLVMTIDGTRVVASVTVGSATLLRETYYPIGGVVAIRDLTSLVTPCLESVLSDSLVIDLTEETYDSQTGTYTTTDTETVNSTVYLCRAELNALPSEYYAANFASMLRGRKTTAPGRKESIWYYSMLGGETPLVVAQYYDGGEITQQTFTLQVQTGAGYHEVDCSPDNYTSPSMTLVRYYVQVGSRRQTFVLDHTGQKGSPALAFRNSFGVFESIYCLGTESATHAFDRYAGDIIGNYRNYRIDETVTHHADTSPLTPVEQAWAIDLFRSTDVWLLNDAGAKWKAVAITDSQVEYDDADNSLVKYTFDYRLSQRNHHIGTTPSLSGIFDATFDPSFE